MSVVKFQEAGDAREPSPSLWKDCPQALLNETKQGTYFFNDFQGPPTGTLAAGEVRPTVGFFGMDADDDTVLAAKASETGGYVDIETDGDDNDAFALITEPLGQVVLDSGKKLWFEARLEVGAVADQGVFVGMAEEAALTRDLIADGAAEVATESMFGFRIASGDTDAFDAIYRLDAGTVAEMLADVTNATAIASGDRAAVAANTEIKLGMRFDGKDKLEVFVNGILVHTETLSTTTFPDGVTMGFAIAAKTGTAAAQSIAIDWAAVAYQERF